MIYKTITNSPGERSRIIHPYCYWENGFTSDELETICKMMTELELENAKFAGSPFTGAKPEAVLDSKVRTSQVSFHNRNEKNAWIFDRLNTIIEMMNNRWYNFDINGYGYFQYSEYHGTDSGHYDWHTDMFTGTLPDDGVFETRKLSVSLLLNEPEIDFTGGEFKFGHELNPETVNFKKGTLILFPSFALHKVAPVIKGIRKSIVIWVLGPKWK